MVKLLCYQYYIQKKNVYIYFRNNILTFSKQFYKSRIVLRYITTFIQTSFTNYKCVACSSSICDSDYPFGIFKLFLLSKGPSGSMSQVLDYLTTHTSLSPIRHGFAPGFVNYEKGRTRLVAASDKAYQLLAHSRWFSSGTPASSTNKTGRHDIAEILLKVALSTNNQSINFTINVRCGVQTFRKENWWVASDEFNTRHTSYVCL